MSTDKHGWDFRLRREAKRHAAFTRTGRMENIGATVRSKAPSPLRSAGAVQNAVDPICDHL